jgi:hypothetical protein
MTLGATSTRWTASDVGGDQGESVYGLRIHEAARARSPGLWVNGVAYASTHRFTVNQLRGPEVVTETGGVSADSDVGGLNINMTLKDGGNRFSAEFNWRLRQYSLQFNNLNTTSEARPHPQQQHRLRTTTASGSADLC